MPSQQLGEAREILVGRTQVGGCTVLSPSDSLTFENCAAVRVAAEEVSGGHKPQVIIECKAVRVMDSASLELLSDLHTEFEARGGALRLINVNDVCTDILTATRLINTLHVYKDLNQAIAGR